MKKIFKLNAMEDLYGKVFFVKIHHGGCWIFLDVAKKITQVILPKGHGIRKMAYMKRSHLKLLIGGSQFKYLLIVVEEKNIEVLLWFAVQNGLQFKSPLF